MAREAVPANAASHRLSQANLRLPAELASRFRGVFAELDSEQVRGEAREVRPRVPAAEARLHLHDSGDSVNEAERQVPLRLADVDDLGCRLEEVVLGDALVADGVISLALCLVVRGSTDAKISDVARVYVRQGIKPVAYVD